ncbi:tRNA 5-methoxyuridine(34)/uridine 5-oxyacetic acid(34) synthase CmoB [Psychrobacter ciconiae]|uniref:tRNA 5-methoxyuridine(34)/uridine 5-oxyacetic acid(34) synthase CmoB n=1 Tax=Psychrobacter ciconiae TaxID=1553449 RepID=UPI00191B00ED|nr:tRNA 5-methoxyuridine(34)/uridine 5-oxyacetic acid(34) synthase CmoB [Psychrobacter ciconiae]
MSSDTIFHAERELYLTLLNLSKYHPKAFEWLKLLPDWLGDIKDKNNFAHAPEYQAIINKLPKINAKKVALDSDNLQIEVCFTQAEFKQTEALLRKLAPWRKGPFLIGSDDTQIFIDTEWRSDFKWQRVMPHLSCLKGRRILDVGGGSGYHGWRMAGLGAKTVIVIDPSCLFYHQFMAIRHFVGDKDDFCTHYIPVPLEALPEHSQLFDTVFSMGVLYHRASPFEHLQQLKGQLVKGGELVLETLVVDGDDTTVLVPSERYAQMNNVYFLPSIAALTLWLKKAGFSEVRCVDVAVTSLEEQRKTDWMTYHSLEDFLDPNDLSKTIEGYPAPKRATFIAKK